MEVGGGVEGGGRRGPSWRLIAVAGMWVWVRVGRFGWEESGSEYEDDD